MPDEVILNLAVRRYRFETSSVCCERRSDCCILYLLKSIKAILSMISCGWLRTEADIVTAKHTGNIDICHCDGAFLQTWNRGTVLIITVAAVAITHGLV